MSTNKETNIQKSKKKKEKKAKALNFDAPEGRAYNNRKNLKIWESALFSG